MIVNSVLEVKHYELVVLFVVKTQKTFQINQIFRNTSLIFYITAVSNSLPSTLSSLTSEIFRCSRN
jgi:hypothetical protein